MAYIYDLADTWADGATTFTAIKMNVTNTASAAGSLLMDLQVGGVSRFLVGRSGDLQLPNGSFIRAAGVQPNSGIRIGGNGFNDPALAVQWVNGASVALSTGRYLAGNSWLGLNSSSVFGWTGTTDIGLGAATLDTILTRDAANTLGQRNGVNAQTFNLYNTYTDASNYERGVFDFTSVANQLTIGTTKAGTGATRIVRFVVGGTRVAISDGAYFQIDKDLYPTENIIMAAKYTEMTEMTAPAAPAANKVRIYAEDDGAGKTRLMALFPTGAAQQIAIEP
jgi:hypothetical protein